MRKAVKNTIKFSGWKKNVRFFVYAIFCTVTLLIERNFTWLLSIYSIILVDFSFLFPNMPAAYLLHFIIFNTHHSATCFWWQMNNAHCCPFIHTAVETKHCVCVCVPTTLSMDIFLFRDPYT